MSDHDDIPELRDSEPDDRPLRPRGVTIVLRVVVITGLVALVLPGVLSTARVQEVTARAACEAWVAYEVAGPSKSSARFEIFGPGLVGWECYSLGAFGQDRHIASLGLIPGPPRLPVSPSRTRVRPVVPDIRAQ